jgi:hypothetical protein
VDTHTEAFHRLVLGIVKKRVTKAYNDAHADNTFLRRGDRLTITDPFNDDVKIGTVSKTDPDDTAEVTDPAAFRDWMATHYPENVRHQRHITGPMDEVVAVLAEHAPHLLSEEAVEVRPWARDEVLRKSVTAGVPVGPGGELDVPGVTVKKGKPTLQVRPNAKAEQVIDGLWASGRLAFDATFRPQLPASEDATQQNTWSEAA